MENMNPDRQSQHRSSVSGPITQPNSDLVMSDQPEDAGMETSHKAVPSRVARKRTKTGCLTCRQRRIKCGEEKPTCNNCAKSKRECKGYAQRLVFKNPLGIPGNQSAFPTYSEQIHTFSLPSKVDNNSVDSQRPLTDSRGPLLAPRIPITRPAENTHYSTAPAHTSAESLPISKPEEPPNSIHQQHHGLSSEFCREPSHDNQAPVKQENSNWIAQELPSNSLQLFDPYQISHTYPTHPSNESSVQSHLPEEQHEIYKLKQSALSISSPLFDYADDDDDDYYDVESDEEAEDQVSLQNFNQLSLIMASANRDEQQVRSFTTYLNEPNVLAAYQPTFGSSPLNNPKTARIFLHFINSIGPSLSIFERHPIDPSTMLGAPVSMAQQGLWTYTLPLKAFEHQALLQAILAISSLHISFLQQVPIAVSLKHYHYALKRVGKAVGLPARRKQVGTIAATLLLAFYEVMTADHTKWGSHLAGSALLLREVDFAGITRDLRSQRRTRSSQRQRGHKPSRSLTDDLIFHSSTSSDDPFSELESSVDETVIGYITGQVINYDEFGQIENEYNQPQGKNFSRKDIESFRIQCDLFWWFCKQDFIQSIVSGSPLFLPYSLWYQCPPRAPLGRLDAIYGSADHVTLLMGRLADFGYRDRKRKLREVKATGSEWKPDLRLSKFMARFAGKRPETHGAPPPSGPFSSPTGTSSTNDWSNHSNLDSRKGSQVSQGTMNTEQRQSPITTPSSGRGASPMYGMIPVTGPRRLPSSFATGRHASVDSSDRNDGDDETSYEDAESEWESILAAFEMFRHTLGPDFLPLPPDSVFPIASPFGPALQYRTHNIGALWTLYYTGRILLHRVHPSMPPAMMVAAGVAAPTTAEYSQIIGKIVAGIYCPQSFDSFTGGLSPTLGSCLVEVSVPIFVAAVQFMDAAQRSWIISVLSNISRLTGWRSSDAIAKGCERAWRTAAEQGRGPPYQRSSDGDTQQVSGWTSHMTTEVVNNRLIDNAERRFVTVRTPPYISWAMGILSLEDHIY